MRQLKNIRVLLSAIVMMVILININGCKYKDKKITNENYKKAKKNITLKCGLTVIDIENNIINFVYNVYNPQKESDILNGIEKLKKVLTQSEYNELLAIANKYDPTKKAKVSNLIVKYSTKDNNTDGMERAYAEFDIEVNNYRQTTAIEFVFNPDGKIFKHYIWNSSVQ